MTRDRSTCHTNKINSDGSEDKTAGVTGVTGSPDITRVTGDRLSPVDRPIRARASHQQTADRVTPVTRHHPGGLTEPVELTHCTRCAQPILRAHSDGILIRADPTPLTTARELTALLNHRATYQLTAYTDGHLEFNWRHLGLIRANHPATVVADHRCPPNTPPLTPNQRRTFPPAVRLTTRRHPATTPSGATCPPF